MKRWTQQPPRDTQLVDGRGANLELQAQRSSLASLDRTQLPSGAYDASRLQPYALHRVWTFDGNALNSSHPGEQSVIRDTDTSAVAWAAVTYAAFTSGWRTAFTVTLPGHKGGHLLLDWAGNMLANNFFAQTVGQAYPGTPRRIALRIRAAGVTLAEQVGPGWYGGNFRVVGGGFVPAGDISVELQFRPTGQGPNDHLEDYVGNQPLLQAHLYGCKLLGIGRWR